MNLSHVFCYEWNHHLHNLSNYCPSVFVSSAEIVNNLRGFRENREDPNTGPCIVCAVVPYQTNSLCWYCFKLFLCWFWKAHTQWKSELYERWSLRTDLWDTKPQWQTSMLNKAWTGPQAYTLAWLKYWIKLKINWNSENKNVVLNFQSFRYWWPFSIFSALLFFWDFYTQIFIHIWKKESIQSSPGRIPLFQNLHSDTIYLIQNPICFSFYNPEWSWVFAGWAPFLLPHRVHSRYLFVCYFLGLNSQSSDCEVSVFTTRPLCHSHYYYL